MQWLVERSPAFRRATFVSAGAGASDLGVDDDDDETMLAGDWFEKRRGLADIRRSPIRTFTVREIRPYLNDIPIAQKPNSPASSIGDVYAWLAGEFALIKRPRRRLVNELDVNRSRRAFMGYWRRSTPEARARPRARTGAQI